MGTGGPSAAVPVWRLVARLVAIGAIATVRLVPVVLVLPPVRLARGRSAARRFWYRRVVRLLPALGPAFVKCGQIISTRRDTLPPELCDELSVLHDAVTPMPPRATDRALRAAFGPTLPDEMAEVDRSPVAGGSIACVYRATLRDGRVVALKVKRPGIGPRMAADLSLLVRLVRACERLPKLRGMPLADLVGYVSVAVLGQLDFAKEAAGIARLRQILAPLPEVEVPMLIAELSRPHCLVFEYIPGLDTSTPDALPAGVRARLAATVMVAANKMMFGAGFVHCDLHPGNIYFTRDRRVVILDAGYTVQLSDRVRNLIGEFFERLAAGDGRRCAEIVLESAVEVNADTDVEGFLSGVAAHVEQAAGPGAAFDLPAFGEKMFDLQREHGLYAASDFAFPLMSLLVLEGTVRGFSADVDFQQIGAANDRTRECPA
jgi:ubiquinone biosynthesis protein